MARNFTNSTDVIRPTFFDPSTPGGGTSYTLSMWFRPTSTNSSGVMISWSDLGSGSNLAFINSGASGWSWYQETRNSGSSGFGGLTGGTWYNLVFTYNGGSSANTLYQNGSQGGNVNTFQIPPTVTHLYIGSRSDGAVALGDIADLCVWYNLILSSGEILALSQGARPYSIRPSFIKAWWPLTGLQSPELDLSGNANNGTVTGTANASGPPVMQFTPRWPLNSPFGTATSSSTGASFLAAWAQVGQRMFGDGIGV